MPARGGIPACIGLGSQEHVLTVTCDLGIRRIKLFPDSLLFEMYGKVPPFHFITLSMVYIIPRVKSEIQQENCYEIMDKKNPCSDRFRGFNFSNHAKSWEGVGQCPMIGKNYPILLRVSIQFSISFIRHALTRFDNRMGAGNLSSSISLYTVLLEIQHNSSTSLILIIFCSIPLLYKPILLQVLQVQIVSPFIH